MSKILVVDDEPLIREKIVEYLEDCVEDLLTAANGKEALEHISNDNDISCIICDVKMPVMDGVETLKALRKSNVEIPFIFYTGHGDDKLIKETKAYDVYYFIFKPELEKLEDILVQGLENNFKPIEPNH